MADSSAHAQTLAHGQKRKSRRQLKGQRFKMEPLKAFSEAACLHCWLWPVAAKDQGRGSVPNIPQSKQVLLHILRTQDWNDPRREGIETESWK